MDIAVAEKTETITLNLDRDVLTRLNDCHLKTEIPTANIVAIALKSYLDELEEDIMDARAGEKAWAEYIASGRKSISLEEYARKEGIDLED